MCVRVCTGDGAQVVGVQVGEQRGEFHASEQDGRRERRLVPLVHQRHGDRRRVLRAGHALHNAHISSRAHSRRRQHPVPVSRLESRAPFAGHLTNVDGEPSLA